MAKTIDKRIAKTNDEKLKVLTSISQITKIDFYDKKNKSIKLNFRNNTFKVYRSEYQFRLDPNYKVIEGSIKMLSSK